MPLTNILCTVDVPTTPNGRVYHLDKLSVEKIISKTIYSLYIHFYYCFLLNEKNQMFLFHEKILKNSKKYKKEI